MPVQQPARHLGELVVTRICRVWQTTGNQLQVNILKQTLTHGCVNLRISFLS